MSSARRSGWSSGAPLIANADDPAAARAQVERPLIALLEGPAT